MNVRIYKPSRSAMQSAHGSENHWILEADTTSGRGPEPLMGWTSSEDTLGQIHITFGSQEDAIRFAEAKGWPYNIANPRLKKVKPRNYSDNFRYSPGKETVTK